MKHLLKMLDLSTEEIIEILDLADQLKYELKHGIPHPHLKGKSLGMIFQKASTRTRVSFETGMYQLGGHALFLSSRDLQIGRGEPVEDTARVLSRYLDGIARRTGEIPIIVEYWLLEVTPRAGLVFVHKNGETAYKNPDNEQQKPSFCTEDYIRQNEINPQHNLPQKSAVEKSVENRRESCTRIMALLQAFTGINMQLSLIHI